MKRLPVMVLSALLALGLYAENPIRVAVFCINDFHGAFVRNDYKGVPGAAAVVETLDSLGRVYPNHATVSAGDNFGGSYFYQATRSQSLLPQFFADCGISISGVGNHEFDEGQDNMLARWSNINRNYPSRDWSLQYVSANIRCDASSKMRRGDTSAPVFCEPYVHQKIALPDGRDFVLGIIGMTTSSTPRQASVSKLKGLHFDGRVQQVLDSLPRQCWEGTHANILLTHQGTATQFIQRGCLMIGQPVWDDADSLALSQLADRRINGIFSSHSHRPVCGLINEAEYPITQGQSNGKYIAQLIIEVDSASLEVVNVAPDLIPVHQFSRLSPKAARLNAQINEQLYGTFTKGGAALGDLLTVAREDIPFDRSLMRHDQTRMGQLVTRAYSEALRQQPGFDDESLIVGVTHIGGMRCGLEAGPVRVLDVGEVLPFDNAMRVFRVTGRQLRDLINFGLHNERYGYLQFAHITPVMDRKGQVKRMRYTTVGGKVMEIKDNSTCYIVADEFVSNGGDGYDPSLFPADQEVQGLQMPHITDAFINYLRTQKEI